MSIDSRPLLIAALLVTGVLCGACGRSGEADRSGDAPVERTSAGAEGSATDQAEHGGETGATETADSAGARTEVSLERIAENGGYTRVDDLPEQSLPPIPDNASRSTGLYEKGGERVGLVLVRYPRAGFAKPHVEDILHRNNNGAPVSILSYDREVVEVRAATPEAASRTAAALAVQLGWSATAEEAERPAGNGSESP